MHIVFNRFAHQLQLALVAIAKSHIQIAVLFNIVINVVNIVVTSYKCQELVRESQFAKVFEDIKKCEFLSRMCLNHETTFKRANDTR